VDVAGFPYGDWEEEALRAAHDVPLVGTVPAIKPAASRTRTGVIGVRATLGTVKREYTTALIHTPSIARSSCTVPPAWPAWPRRN